MLPIRTTPHTIGFVAKAPQTSHLLRQLREESGRSLRKTASELGVTPSHLSRLERGEKSASDGLSMRFAGYYGVQLDLLFLADNRVPIDILEILKSNPGVLAELRERSPLADPVRRHEGVRHRPRWRRLFLRFLHGNKTRLAGTRYAQDPEIGNLASIAAI